MKTVLLATILSVLLAPGPSIACDSDDECNGGACIKREKRAAGVCYGGDLSQTTIPMHTTTPEPGLVEPISGHGINAPIPGVGLFNPLANPAKRPANACVVTQDCRGGMDCVITGSGWGTCVNLH
ncbi:MAG TPA: hypothetical protein DGR97_04235 [Gammaproteobacteria bacterium]|nr:hypothetical protein [Gammaproteobacteria bacterium]